MLATLCLAVILGAHLGAPSANADDPSLRGRLTNRGVNALGQIALDFLNTEIKSIQIPDIDDGDIKATNIHIVSYHSPASDIALQSPSTATWNLKGAQIDLTAHVTACKKILGHQTCESVDADTNATGIDIQVAVAVGRNPNDQERPTILSTDCTVNIGKLDINIKGGVIGWILDLFKSLVEHYVKPQLEKAFCDEAKDFLMNTVNKQLATLPVDIVLLKELDLDLGLAQDPVIQPGYLELDLKGQVTDPKAPSIVSPNPVTPLAEEAGQSDKMAYGWISDKVINDLFYFAHTANLTHFLFTKDTPEIGDLLYLQCGTICLGSMIPNVTILYPGVVAAEMAVSTASVPYMKVGGDGVAKLGMDLAIYTYAPTATAKLPIFEASFGAKGAVHLTIEDQLVKGNATIDDLALTIYFSTLDEEIMDYLVDKLQTYIKPLMEKNINDKLAKGIEIPVIHNVTLQNSQVWFLQNTIQVESDVSYSL